MCVCVRVYVCVCVCSFFLPPSLPLSLSLSLSLSVLSLSHTHTLTQELYATHGVPYAQALREKMLPYLEALHPKVAALKSTTGVYLEQFNTGTHLAPLTIHP